MKEWINARRNREILLTISMAFLPISIFSFHRFSADTVETGINLGVGYVLVTLFIPYLLINLKKLRIPPWYMVAFYAYTIIISILKYKEYGINKAAWMHYTMALYLIIVILNIGNDFGWNEWKRILNRAALFFALIHFVYMAIHISMIKELFCGYWDRSTLGIQAANLPSITNAGRNIDATWLVLGGFFVKGKVKPLYLIYTVLFSFLGCSRVGVIGSTLLLLWIVIYDDQLCITKKNIKYWAVIVSLGILFLGVSGQLKAFAGRMNGSENLAEEIAVERTEEPVEENELESISTEAADKKTEAINLPEALTKFLSGREAMWKYIPGMILEEPTGYGAGNAIVVLKTQYGFEGTEGNVHNVYAQVVLEQGIIGGIWYILMVLLFIRGAIHNRFSHPLEGYMGIYFLLELIQFRGYEPTAMCILGIYLLQKGAYITLFKKDEELLAE